MSRVLPGEKTMNDAYGGGSLKPGYQGKGMIVYEPLSVLSLRQRLGRLRFACYQFGAALLSGLLIALFLLLSVELLPQWVGWGVAAVVSLALLVYQIGLLVRRLHDMEKKWLVGHPGVCAVGQFAIPALSLSW
jgi:uncharacterized membrane protein YhaH (DUF805 family)